MEFDAPQLQNREVFIFDSIFNHLFIQLAYSYCSLISFLTFYFYFFHFLITNLPAAWVSCFNIKLTTGVTRRERGKLSQTPAPEGHKKWWKREKKKNVWKCAPVKFFVQISSGFATCIVSNFFTGCVCAGGGGRANFLAFPGRQTLGTPLNVSLQIY